MRGLPSRVKTHQRHSGPGGERSADTQEVLLTSRCALFGLPLRLPARRLARPPAMQDIDAIGMPVRSLSGVLQDVRMIGRQFKVIVLDDFGIVFRPHCQTTTRPSPASSSSVMTSRTVAIARRLDPPPPQRHAPERVVVEDNGRTMVGAAVLVMQARRRREVAVRRSHPEGGHRWQAGSPCQPTRWRSMPAPAAPK